MIDGHSPLWTPSRNAGLLRVEAFSGSMGRHYTAQRNTDFGPEDRTNTSILSPYLRRRLISEGEVVAAALEQHGLKGAEKFVQEVFWRTYFKGWLERRPVVWAHYCETLAQERERLDGDAALRDAMDGATGIACFDAWARELVETGYLHNHARMWFASIWIFTLRLPWVLGADFFMRHLLDGDPASNTLSWRWVGGLHTRGKHYAAAPWNIAKFTDGHFTPGEAELAQDPEPLTEAFDYGEPLPVRGFVAVDAGARSALLLTVEDCLPESLGVALGDMAGVGGVCVSAAGAVAAVRAFDEGAIADAAARIAPLSGKREVTMLDPADPGGLARWAEELGVEQIVTAFIPVGPTRAWLDQAEPALASAGVRLAEVQREWDAAVWPLATAGFFKVKKQISRVLQHYREGF